MSNSSVQLVALSKVGNATQHLHSCTQVLLENAQGNWELFWQEQSPWPEYPVLSPGFWIDGALSWCGHCSNKIKLATHGHNSPLENHGQIQLLTTHRAPFNKSPPADNSGPLHLCCPISHCIFRKDTMVISAIIIILVAVLTFRSGCQCDLRCCEDVFFHPGLSMCSCKAYNNSVMALSPPTPALDTNINPKASADVINMSLSVLPQVGRERKSKNTCPWTHRGRIQTAGHDNKTL